MKCIKWICVCKNRGKTFRENWFSLVLVSPFIPSPFYLFYSSYLVLDSSMAPVKRFQQQDKVKEPVLKKRLPSCHLPSYLSHFFLMVNFPSTVFPDNGACSKLDWGVSCLEVYSLMDILLHLNFNKMEKRTHTWLEVLHNLVGVVNVKFHLIWVSQYSLRNS